MLPAEDNGSHMYELEVSQRLKPQGGNATILPPKMRLTQADFNFLIQTQKNIKASKNQGIHEHRETFGCQQNNSQLVLLSGRSGVQVTSGTLEDDAVVLYFL